MQGIVGEAAEGEFRRVGEADDDRAGLLQVAHHGQIRRRDEVLVGGNAIEIRTAFVVDILLDRDRYAMQKAEFTTFGAPLVGRMRRSQRLLREIDDDGVQPRIDSTHPLQMRLDGLDRGDGAGADRGCGFDRRPLPGRAFGAARCGRFARGGLLDRLRCSLRNLALANGVFLLEDFAAFFALLFFLVAVFFATSHLLKLRRGSYGGHATVYRRVSAWRAVATRCRGRRRARDAHEPLGLLP